MYVAEFLRHQGWQPLIYELDQVPGIHDHAIFRGGRDYTGRPNVGVRKPGAGADALYFYPGILTQCRKALSPGRTIPSEEKWRTIGYLVAAQTI
jgi:hypothetical protein